MLSTEHPLQAADGAGQILGTDRKALALEEKALSPWPALSHSAPPLPASRPGPHNLGGDGARVWRVGTPPSPRVTLPSLGWPREGVLLTLKEYGARWARLWRLGDWEWVPPTGLRLGVLIWWN